MFLAGYDRQCGTQIAGGDQRVEHGWRYAKAGAAVLQGPAGSLENSDVAASTSERDCRGTSGDAATDDSHPAICYTHAAS
jgi:hypothetical protein